MTQWYVWLVGRFAPHVPWGEQGEWWLRGVFDSHDRALAAAQRGDFICLLAMNDTPTGQMVVEWVQ